MKIKRLLLVFMMLPMMLLSITAMAQDKVVTGKVTDSKDGTPVQGVSVTVKGTKLGVQTGSDGSFKIKVPSSATTFVVSSIGYASQEVAISDESVKVSLVQAKSDLSDLVVVAYGTRKKTDLTGSVTAVSAKDFQKGAIASSEQLLQGKVAGLQVTSGGGSAGGGSTIRIRGAASLNASNDPLIVIDGVPTEGNSINGGGNILSTINPNDIESMSVLKDASATALYGSRASNGVIIVTTKKGTKGKIKFNFNTLLSVGSVTKYVDVYTGDEIRSIVKASGNTGLISKLGTANTDWQKLIYQNAVGWDKNISASGAIANVLPFRLALENLSQEGILLTDKFDRNAVSLNLSPKLFKDYLSVNVNAKYANTKFRHADGGAVGAAASFDPTQSVNQTNKFGGYYEWLNTDGSPVGNNGNASNPNPLSLLKFRNNHETVNRFIGNVQIDYKVHFLPDLHILINGGIDNTSQKDGEDYYDSTIVTQYVTKGRRDPYKQDKANQILETSLFYTKELKNVKFDALVGHSYQNFETDVYNLPNYKLNGDTVPNTVPLYATDKPTFRMESYFGRFNFTFMNKYLLTASVRRDASSKFSSANRVGYFPAFAFAWKLKDEFFKNTKDLNDLKLRIGYGKTGNQDGIGNYDYLARYSVSNPGAYYMFGADTVKYIRPSAYNPNLHWESTLTLNFGLDFAFLNNRVSGTIDYYNKKTSDLLSIIPQAPGENYDIQVMSNIGNIENSGVEFVLNTVPIKEKNFSWDFGFNITYQTTKITNLVAVTDPSFTGIPVGVISGGTGNNIEVHMVGYSPYHFYLSQQVYDSKSGKPIEGLYEDINRDGTGGDRYYYSKDVQPSILIGFNTQLTYKKFSLGFSGHGSIGNYMYNNYASNNGALNAILNGSVISNGSRSYSNTGFVNKQFLSDYYLENASYFRMDNINLGYNVGRVFNQKATLRVYGSVQNVFVITKYTGLDPENSNNGIDNNIYPRPRVFSLGANLDF